ncbi:MAG: InlB B-repeat-containing protein, partial [Prevotellaceae bacterium]|nr:InlB B-repeat-containing protein [Prevotellaceae bacterium]
TFATTYRRSIIYRIYIYKKSADSPTPSIALSRDSIGFGEVLSGSSETLTFTLTPRNLTGALTLTPATTVGSGSVFSVEPTTIAQGVQGDTTIRVTFTPSAVVAYAGTLTIAGGGADTVVKLTGAGTAANTPSLTVSETTLSFDTIMDSYQSRSFTVSTAYIGAETQLSLGKPASYFSLSPTTVPDNTTDFTVTVTYHAVGIMAFADTISVSGAGIVHKVALSGMPRRPTIAASTQPLSFSAIQGAPVSKKLLVRGSHLKDNIALATKNTSSAFTLSKSTVDKAKAGANGGDTITVTFNATTVATDTLELTTTSAQAIKIALNGTLNRYDNLALNPGFEAWEGTAPDSWTIGVGTKENTLKHGGSNAVKVVATSTQSIIQYVEGVEVGKHYTISFWYYIDGASTGNGLRIWSQFRVGSSNISVVTNDSLQPTAYQTTKGEWVKFSIGDYVAPADADNFRFEVRTMNGATAYFDDFFFGEVNNEVTPPTPNDPKKYTVTFNSNGGSEVPPMVNVDSGAVVTEPTTSPTRDGYTFEGWYREMSGANAWDFASDKVTSDTTLYAYWTEDEPQPPLAVPKLDDGSLTIYPNPVDDILHLVSAYKVAKVQIYTQSGALLLEDKAIKGIVYLPALRSGLYIAKVTFTNGALLSKMFVKK